MSVFTYQVISGRVMRSFCPHCPYPGVGEDPESPLCCQIQTLAHCPGLLRPHPTLLPDPRPTSLREPQTSQRHSARLGPCWTWPWEIWRRKAEGWSGAGVRIREARCEIPADLLETVVCCLDGRPIASGRRRWKAPQTEEGGRLQEAAYCLLEGSEEAGKTAEDPRTSG